MRRFALVGVIVVGVSGCAEIEDVRTRHADHVAWCPGVERDSQTLLNDVSAVHDKRLDELRRIARARKTPINPYDDDDDHWWDAIRAKPIDTSDAAYARAVERERAVLDDETLGGFGQHHRALYQCAVGGPDPRCRALVEETVRVLAGGGMDARTAREDLRAYLGWKTCASENS